MTLELSQDPEYKKGVTIHASEGHMLFPLDQLIQLEDWVFDVEETVIGHDPEDLKRHFAYFLLWVQNTDLPPKTYITLMENQVPIEVLVNKIAQVSQRPPDSVLAMVNDFAEITHVDDLRLRDCTEFLGLSIRDIWAAYTAYWNEISDHSPIRAAEIAPAAVIPGAIDLLNSLYERDSRIHFITNGGEDRVRKLLEMLSNFGFKGEYSTFQSASTLGYKKPNPHTLHNIAKLYGIHTTGVQQDDRIPVVMIGNSFSDMQFGENGGCVAKILVNPIDIYGQNIPTCYQVPDLRYIAQLLTQ